MRTERKSGMKKIFNSRALALILVLAMAVSLFTISASAATSWSLTGHGTNIASITIDGADFYEPNYTISTDTHGTIYDYYIALNGETADGTAVAAHFTKSDSAAADCVISRVGPAPNPPQGYQIVYGYRADDYSATVEEGTALARAYVHTDMQASWGTFDTYVFHYYLPYSVSISTGDPVFIAWDGNSGTVAGRDGASTIPSSFTLWVKGVSTITVDGTTVASDYSNDGNYAFTISPKISGNTTIVATVDGVAYTVTCGPKTTTASGASPSAVLSYLPIGQFAQGSGWGSVTGKFVGKDSLDSTGVSLGAFGGYIEFDFQQYNADGSIKSRGITNDENNPYGVDFVVYGNAFAGNPEAGAVQVSEDGITWYELAGSRYYDGNFDFTGTKVTNKFSKAYSGTLNNATVTYDGSTLSQINVTAAANGTNVFSNKLLVSSYGWWPTVTKGYPMIGSHSNTGSNVQVSHSDTALTFSGLTMIPDSDTTADYAFGYADVTPNGSPATYGDAVNPYTPYTSGKTGGDGFDLEWAVDTTTGLPIDVTGRTFRYVRVYTAVLDNGTFGETSAEVCGIFTTANKSTATVGRTGISSLTINDGDEIVGNIEDFAEITEKGNVVIYDMSGYGISAATIEATAATGSTIYMNNAVTSSYTTNANTEYVRVIVQSGEKAPYIAVIKLG